MSSFVNASRKISTDFLQNVVIIDDELYFQNIDNSNESTTDINVNSLHERTEVRVGRNTQVLTTPSSGEPSVSDTHDVNITKLTDSFSQNSILCSFIKPSPNDNIKEKYTHVLKKADLLILDWKLQAEDNGTSAKSFIEDIIKDEPDSYKNSTRYIAIYSGENNLLDKLDEVELVLIDLGLNVDKNEEFYILKSGHLIIRFFAKPSQRNQVNEYVVVTEDKLVERIIEDYIQSYSGLVSNMALKATTILRKNIHRILTTFSKDLDEAYLSHRALLPESTDAEEFMVDLLISELHSILIDSNDIKDTLNINSIMKWFDHKFDDENYHRLLLNKCFININNKDRHSKIKEHFNISETTNLKIQKQFDEVFPDKISENKKVVQNLVKKIFEENIETTDCEILKQKKDKIKLEPFTKYLYQNDSDWEKSESELALLSTIKNRYSLPIPYMTLGTIVKDKNDEYYICIIPRCDSARIDTNERKFPFLKLKEINDNKKFEIIINDDNSYKKFGINYEPYEMTMFTLEKYKQYLEHKDKPLYSQKNKKGYAFRRKGVNPLYWVGQMKSEKAQYIANNFSSKLSRVGFNESEYLRRSYQ